MKDLVYDLYMKQNLNCAQTILQAVNIQFNLNLGFKTVEAMAGFGGGMQEEDVCGVVSGGVAALSILFSESFEKKLMFYSAIIDFKANIRKQFGSIDCRFIKPGFRDESQGCLKVILTSYEILVETIRKYF